MNAQALLNQIAQYVCLSEDEQVILISQLTYRRYLKGQYVIQQGDVYGQQSYVLSGCLKAFHMDDAGDEHIIMFFDENRWIGDVDSCEKQTAAPYHVQCLEHTELLQLSHLKLEWLYEKIPKFERYFRMIAQQALRISEKRIIQSLSLTAKERYLNFVREYPQLEQRVPQYLIASYLGITKEFLSKIRNQKPEGKSYTLSS